MYTTTNTFCLSCIKEKIKDFILPFICILFIVFIIIYFTANTTAAVVVVEKDISCGQVGPLLVDKQYCMKHK